VQGGFTAQYSLWITTQQGGATVVVVFTPNIALAKPSLAEVAKNWVTGPALASANNGIITNKSDINMQSYTPTIIAQTTAPNLGSGTATGRYQRHQGWCWGTFILLFTTGGTGLSAGSGEYGVSLPTLADNSFHSAGTALNSGFGGNACVGEGWIQDNSVVDNCGSVALELMLIGGASYVRMLTEAFPAKTSRVVRDAQPFTVAHADTFAGMFIYKET
jgi:hypothetical protein